jgi:large repetitive protein
VGNSVVVDEGGGDPDPVCPSCATDHPVAEADLELVKTLITDGPYLVGETVVFEIVVTNHGPSDATNIEVTDTPTNLTDLTVIDAGGADCAGDQFPCSLAGLAVDASFTIVVQAELVDEGPFLNEATVTATEPDPEPNNNSDSDGSVVGVGDPDPAVTVVKLADPASGETVVAGQTITYTLTVTVADGPTTADVVLVDTLGAWPDR